MNRLLTALLAAAFAASAGASLAQPAAAPARPPPPTPEQIEEGRWAAALDSVLSLYTFSRLFMLNCHEDVEALPLFTETEAAYVARNRAILDEVNAIKVRLPFYHPGIDEQILNFNQVRVTNRLLLNEGDEKNACRQMAGDIASGMYDLATYSTAVRSLEILRTVPAAP